MKSRHSPENKQPPLPNPPPPVPANQASPMSPIDQVLPVSHNTLADAPDQQPLAPDVVSLALVEPLPKKSDVEPVASSQPENVTPEQVGLEPIIGASAYSQLGADSSEQESLEPVVEPSISSESEAETSQQVSSESPLESLTVTSQPTAPEQAVPDPARAFIPVASSTAASLPVQSRKARSRKRGVLLPISIALLVGVIIGIALWAVFLSSTVYHGSRPASPTRSVEYQSILQSHLKVVCPLLL